jgi:hypothetical protein
MTSAAAVEFDPTTPLAFLPSCYSEIGKMPVIVKPTLVFARPLQRAAAQALLSNFSKDSIKSVDGVTDDAVLESRDG